MYFQRNFLQKSYFVHLNAEMIIRSTPLLLTMTAQLDSNVSVRFSRSASVSCILDSKKEIA